MVFGRPSSINSSFIHRKWIASDRLCLPLAAIAPRRLGARDRATNSDRVSSARPCAFLSSRAADNPHRPAGVVSISWQRAHRCEPLDFWCLRASLRCWRQVVHRARGPIREAQLCAPAVKYRAWKSITAGLTPTLTARIICLIGGAATRKCGWVWASASVSAADWWGEVR